MREYDIDEMTVGSILEDKAKTNKGRIVARFKDTAVTYDELNSTANRVANSLSEIGIKKGLISKTAVGQDLQISISALVSEPSCPCAAG